MPSGHPGQVPMKVLDAHAPPHACWIPAACTLAPKMKAEACQRSLMFTVIFASRQQLRQVPAVCCAGRAAGLRAAARQVGALFRAHAQLIGQAPGAIHCITRNGVSSHGSHEMMAVGE